MTALIERLDSREEVELPLGSAVGGSMAALPLALAWFGVGKSSTAAGVALAIERLRPQAVVQVGIGGAFEGSRLDLGGAAVAGSELHLDLGVSGQDGVAPAGESGLSPGEGASDLSAQAGSLSGLEELGLYSLERPFPVHNRVPVDEGLAAALARGSIPLLPFGTAETVTGTRSGARQLFSRWGIAVESMEGAAAAQTCYALGVPFGEVRGISNFVGERDKARWEIPAALAAAQAVLLEWIRAGAPRAAASGPAGG